jgi:hypothetical protein
MSDALLVVSASFPRYGWVAAKMQLNQISRSSSADQSFAIGENNLSMAEYEKRHSGHGHGHGDRCDRDPHPVPSPNSRFRRWDLCVLI